MAGPRLIDLQTDLKSLRYGSDKPYITKDINNPPTSNQTGMQILKRVDDLSRIAQMLIDRPGLKFIGNQALLQQVDVQDKLQKSRDNGKTFAGALLQQGLSTVKQTAKILGSTIAQVPVNGTGTHFVYAFRTDTYLQPSGGNTRSAFAQFFGAGGVEGAPLALKGKPINGVVESKFGTQKDGVFKIDPDLDKDYGYNANVFNGKELKDYDEVRNKPIPENKFQGKFFSKLGKTVTIDTGSMGPKDPLVKTKLQQSKAGNLNIGTIPVLEAGAPPALGGTTPVYSYENTFTGTSAFGASLYAQGGTPIPVISGSAQKDTTTAVEGSTSHQGIEGSGLPLSEDNLPKNVYTDATPYTGVTDAVFKAASTGSIPFTKYKNDNSEIRNQKSISQANSGSHSQDVDALARTYTDRSTYTTEQKNRKIGSSTKYAVKEKRVALGDQGASSKAGVNYWTNPSQTEIDQINSLDVTTAKPDGVGAGRDLAKLYFEVLPIEPEAPSQFLYFRAHIDNLSDDYGAEWEGHRYVGRAEEFYTYGGFNRTITLDFKVAAATRVEMKPLYKKMVYLASTTAPTYGGVYSKFMRGTFTKLTVGSYLDQMPGIITSVKYSLIDGMPWEIAMGQPEGVEPESQVLPMGLQCSVTFKPIHDFAPQTGLYHYFTNGTQNPRFF